MSTGAATVEPAPFEAFLSSLLAGRNANKSATAGSTESGDHSSSSASSAAPSTASAAPAPEMVNAKSTVDATNQIDSPSLSSTSTPPSPPSTSSLPSSPSSPSSSSTSSSSSGDTAPPTETTDESQMQTSAGGTNPTANTTATNNTADGRDGPESAKAMQAGDGSESSTTVPFDVTSSSGREALLLRFLHLLPDIHELQQALNLPRVGGGDESKACQQLVLEVVVALRLWVVQQPLTLGRPLSADNPSLFSLLRPQLGRLPWWRAPTYTAAPSRYPTTSASTSSSAPPVPPLEDDLLALAWGNRAWQPSPAPDPSAPVLKEERDGSSPDSSPPLPSTHHHHYNLPVPVVKIDHPLPHGAGPVTGTIIKMAGAGPTENNEGFEFNENDSALELAHSSKRRRSMDATLEVAGIMARQPARDQALRKRRKSVIDRTSTIAAGSARQEEETTPGRDLRKRKASVPSPGGSQQSQLTQAERRGEETGGMSPKKIKFDDEDYVDSHAGSGGSGREAGEKEKEAHRDVADSATPVRGARGRGPRGRGARGARTRGGRGGRGGNREKDLEGVPKTKARKPESCHRCKNKKEFWVGCPLVASHKYCRGCVVRHFAIDYDDFRANPENYWTDGCPICHLTCPCIGCVRKKKNGQQGGGAEDEDRVDVEKDDDDEVGDPDEDDAEGYGDYDDDEDDGGEDGGDENDGDGEEDAHIDVDVHGDEDEQKSVENLIEVKWSALKRQLDVKDSSSSPSSSAAEEAGQGHLPVKKRMSRMRSNSFANGNGPSSRGSAMALLDEALAHHVQQQQQQQQQQPPRKRAPRLRSYSTSHCSDPKPASAVNPEDFLGRTGAGSVLAARYNSPMRRGPRGSNSRGTH